MLRTIRIILAWVFLIGITLLFTGIGQGWFGWMAKLQFLPSLLALNLCVIIGLVLFTLLLGRIYCSVICPLGLFQDLIIKIRRTIGNTLQKSQAKRVAKLKAQDPNAKPRLRKYIKQFTYSKEHKAVRYGVLALSIVSLVASGQMFIALIAPYSAYGRMVRSVVASGADSVTTPLIATGLATLVIIVVCAWLWGREYCNTICPVGTTLGLLSRFSLFRPTINRAKCVDCGLCARNCKASCIDSLSHKIDYSRCVDCFDCLKNCKSQAINITNAYSNRCHNTTSDEGNRGAIDEGRRSFLVTGAVVASGLAANAQGHMHGGLADLADKQMPERTERLVPPGANSVKHFYNHCTACQLCVSACKNGVLHPSVDLEHFLQPFMSYEKGFCRPECTACSQVCPAGAIKPISPEQKQIIRIGIARVDTELCIAAKRGGCGSCARHCPTGAIRMVRKDGTRQQIPTISEERCIGCGACENRCPIRPISAITVNGISIHHNS